jgi:putative transposase
VVGSQARREAVLYCKKQYKISERVACEQINISRSTYRYKTIKKEEKEIKEKILKIAKTHPCYGYRRIFAILKRRKIFMNQKKVYRLYKELNLAYRKRKKKKYSNKSTGIQDIALSTNELWAMDFMSDRLVCGKKIRILNIIDTYSRECLLIEIATSFPSLEVIKQLEIIIKNRGAPKAIRLDNGPEYISKAIIKWSAENGIILSYIRPGKPFENGHMESFNDKCRKEFLNRNIFRSILEARILAKSWKDYYNKKRPHSSLSYMTPEEYVEKSPAIPLWQCCQNKEFHSFYKVKILIYNLKKK